MERVVNDIVEVRPARSLAVSVAGFLLLLLGAAQIYVGGDMVLWAISNRVPPSGWEFIYKLLEHFSFSFGFGHLSLGILGLLAGVSTFARRRWGCILGLMIALIAIPNGFLWFHERGYESFGIAQILIGFISGSILSMSWDEFGIGKRNARA
jgi:hypothetical protein